MKNIYTKKNPQSTVSRQIKVISLEIEKKKGSASTMRNIMFYNHNFLMQ